MIDMKKLRELDDRYDRDLKKVTYQRMEAEDSYQSYMQTTENLKEQVYHILGGDIPEEAKPYYYQMDMNTDNYVAAFTQNMSDLDDREAELRKNYDNKVDELYYEAKKQEQQKDESHGNR